MQKLSTFPFDRAAVVRPLSRKTQKDLKKNGKNISKQNKIHIISLSKLN